MTVVLLLLLGCTDKGPGGEDGPGDGDGGGTVAGPDADGDGFPSVESGGDDCDDTDAMIHPDATEVWYDGVDQDCDGWSDYDADQDGADSDAWDGDDCDDMAPTVRPGALELCDNGVDEDCDDQVDEAVCGVPLAEAVGDWHDEELQFLGAALAVGCDVDADGQTEVLASAPGDVDEGVVGKVVVLEEGGEVTYSPATVVLASDLGAGLGSGIDCLGDLDGHGLGDLLVTAQSEGPSELGRTRGFSIPLDGGTLDSESEYIFDGIEGEVYLESFGHKAFARDVTGDGFDDVVYSLSDFYGPWDAGASRYYGGSIGVIRAPMETGTHLGLSGALTFGSGQFGEFDISDIDGDGINDIITSEDPLVDKPDRCGVVYSGADLAGAADGTGFGDGYGALARLDCPSVLYSPTWVWSVTGSQDLDLDGYNDVFLTHDGGWSAFQGGAGVWTDVVSPASRLQADFCGYHGVRDAAFTRDDDDALTWAVSLHGIDCTRYAAGFSGRVALFDDWAWTEWSFDDARSWMAWEPDWLGLEPFLHGSRHVAFSQSGDRTLLWFADGAWMTISSTEPDVDTIGGRVVAFDLASFDLEGAKR